MGDALCRLQILRAGMCLDKTAAGAEVSVAMMWHILGFCFRFNEVWLCTITVGRVGLADTDVKCMQQGVRL